VVDPCARTNLGLFHNIGAERRLNWFFGLGQLAAAQWKKSDRQTYISEILC
jgi:hypothetical protein